MEKQKDNSNVHHSGSNNDHNIVAGDFADLQSILDAIPQPTALLNAKYQLLRCNHFMAQMLSETKEFAFQKRVGDAFGCVNAHKGPSGCGSSENCQFCTIQSVLKEADQSNLKTTHDCHLTLGDMKGRFRSHMNLRVTVSPFEANGQRFFIFIMVDISNDIRRRMLERIFFHDVLNKAGNITGILDLLTAYQNNQLKSDELLGSLKVTANDLIEEILYQRDLSAAENNELKPKNEEFRSLEILSQIKQQIENSEIANGKVVVTDPVSVNLIFVTDGLLLRRVLLNMLKNALEAVNRSSTITIGCRHILPDRIQFWVHNNTVMPTEIQMQLFNKSFSTKEAGRGLGTYSIKLLGEKYLKGKVTFVSTNETGTIFCIELPVTPSAAPLNDQNS